MDIFHLLYRSKSVGVPDSATLGDILVVARRRNKEDLISGFLIYRDGYYMQLLEGPQKKVRECLARIEADKRNTALTILGEVHSSNRMMPDWSMAHVMPAQVKVSSESYIDLFDLGSSDDLFRDKQALEVMLRLFSKHALHVTQKDLS